MTPDQPHVPSKRPLRILYAEDMPELRDVASITLARDGHQVECAADGRIASEKISSGTNAFDVVITDHHMPHMNGLELVKHLRALPFPGKIVVFSSELSRDVADAYRDLKVDSIIYKPVFPSVFRRMLVDLYAPAGTER